MPFVTLTCPCVDQLCLLPQEIEGARISEGIAALSQAD
jgi:hypothetical protein